MNDRADARAPHLERGAVSTEYALVTFAVVSALFIVPVTGDGRTAVAYVMDALRLFQQNTTFLLSLP